MMPDSTVCAPPVKSNKRDLDAAGATTRQNRQRHAVSAGDGRRCVRWRWRRQNPEGALAGTLAQKMDFHWPARRVILQDPLNVLPQIFPSASASPVAARRRNAPIRASGLAVVVDGIDGQFAGRLRLVSLVKVDRRSDTAGIARRAPDLGRSACRCYLARDNATVPS